jgi:hypothetical protein
VSPEGEDSRLDGVVSCPEGVDSRPEGKYSRQEGVDSHTEGVAWVPAHREWIQVTRGELALPVTASENISA